MPEYAVAMTLTVEADSPIHAHTTATSFEKGLGDLDKMIGFPTGRLLHLHVALSPELEKAIQVQAFVTDDLPRLQVVRVKPPEQLEGGAR